MIRYLRTVIKMDASWDAVLFDIYTVGWHFNIHHPLSTIHVSRIRKEILGRCDSPTCSTVIGTIAWQHLSAIATFENDMILISERNEVHGQWNATWKNNRDTCSDLPRWRIITCVLKPFEIRTWPNIRVVELCQKGTIEPLQLSPEVRSETICTTELNRLLCWSEISFHQYDHYLIG